MTKLQSSDVLRKTLLVDSDPKRRKVLEQVFTRVLGPPEARDVLGDVPKRDAFDLMVVHYDGLSEADRQKLQEYVGREEVRVLVLAAGKSRDDLSSLFRSRTLTNVVASADTVDIDELIVTCQKILRRDIFGLEKYFVWGATTRVARVVSSGERKPLLEDVATYTQQIGIPQRLATVFQNVVDEFLSNALYNSPVDKQGKHRFSDLARTKDIALDPGEHIEVKLCCDSQRLGVSIVDPFGSLAPQTILDYLAKCFRRDDQQVDDKPGGAGLGLYQILDGLSHFVINIDPGKITEMIGLIDVRGSYKDFVVKGKSFNIFIATESDNG